MPARKFGDGGGRSRGPEVTPEAILTGDNLQRLWVLVMVGCLVSVSRSRDGGALALTVFSDGKSEREWFRDPQACADWLDDVALAIDSGA